MSSATQHGQILNSWKEIASHLGRGVRTVQRWEHLGLPVRRPRGKSRSAVIALADEIDAWLRSAPTSELERLAAPDGAPIKTLRESRESSSELRDRCMQLRSAHETAMTQLIANLKRTMKNVNSLHGNAAAIGANGDAHRR